MTIKTTKTALFAALILSMTVSVTGFGSANAATANDDPTKDFTGTLETKTKKIGDFFHIKQIYTSDELAHYNVDHIYKEEIRPIPEDVDEKAILDYIGESKITEGKKLGLVYDDKIDDLQEFQNERNDGMPIHAYEQWKVVERKADSVTNVAYNPNIVLATHVEDWARKDINHVYAEYDPINLIWTDSASRGGDLMSKVDRRMSERGWNDLCFGGDLWINIAGTWTKQTRDFREITFLTACDQYHVRAWEINDDLVIGAAHEEKGEYVAPWERLDIRHISATGLNYLERNAEQYGVYHAVTGFDTAEDEAAGLFTGSCWTVSRDSHNMHNQYTRITLENGVQVATADNDGYATVIRCS